MTTQDLINSRYDLIVGRNDKKAYDIAAGTLEFRESTTIPEVSNHLKYTEIVEMHLAMLFVDIKGYTKLVQDQNPKKIARIMTLYVTEMGAAIRHHEGTIVSIEGDGLLAAFNAKENHKFNACEKAVRCAVTMNTLLEFVVNKRLKDIGYDTLNCRYGVDYGRVIIKRAGIRGEGKNELLFIGKATNHASKFLSIASSNELVISEDVYTNLSESYTDSNKGWNWSGNVSSDYGGYRKKSVGHWKGTEEAE